MITLQGHLERITYRHERSHYTIGKLRVDETRNIISVVGYMAGAQAGDSLRLQGNWETHEKYGQQFRATAVEIIPADPLESIRKFLSSGFIKGIGPKLTGKLLTHFDADILNVLETDSARLSEVPGISASKAEGIADAWRTHHGARRAMMFLQAHGIKPFHCARILNALGSDAVEIIKNDPYRLSMDVHEIDFFLADRLAVQMGVAPDDLRRLEACLLYLVEQAISWGDTFVERSALMERCASIVQVTETPIAAAIDALVSAGMLKEAAVGEDPVIEAVYPAAFYEAETGIANRISALMTVPLPPAHPDRDKITEEIVRKLAIKPSDGQLEVLSEISSHRAVIITGGPGTGKTTLIRSICAVFGSAGKRICLAAPTGRAARRLAEVTGRKAGTIHKLLGYHLEEGRFERDENDPLDADVVIVDETSMVDTLLMHHLLRAVPMSAVLILVGDVFQLPPVGPGNVLSDLIESGRIRTFELNEIFRQAGESPIILNAHRVRAGRMPDLEPGDPESGDSEFYFIERNQPNAVVDTVLDLCSSLIPRCFGLDPIRDIQVLTPMHKGEGGTLNLNRMLQDTLNPNRLSTDKKGRIFRQGDKVMHLKNNYQKEVFNGDIGMVSQIDNEDEELLVDFDGREVAYAFDELEELSLAYAISVHKSQGSEYPAVVLPMMTQHYVLLQRNLLYTALTRAQRLVFIVGSRKAVEIALHNDKPQRRLSGLSYWLKLA